MTARLKRVQQRRGAGSSRRSLDSFDLQILELLQKDAKQTNQQLAERVALSPSACLARVRRLEKLGVIAAYRAVLDPVAIGGMVRFIAHAMLKNHRTQDFRRFERGIAGIPEIVEVHQVCGTFDYSLTIVCRDVERFREINDAIVDGGLGVRKVTSYLVLASRLFAGYSLATLRE